MEDFATSEKTNHIVQALRQIQNFALAPKRNSKNPHFGNEYANLESVLDACRNKLTENDLTVFQAPLGGVDVCRLLVRIEHGSGEWFQYIFSTPLAKRDPQGICAAVTYLRRYSLTTMLNMVDTDDDGNHASQHTPKQEPKGFQGSNLDIGQAIGTHQGPPKYKLTEKQLKRLYAISKASGYDPSEVGVYIKSHYGVQSSMDLTRSMYEEVCNMLEARQLPKPGNGHHEETIESPPIPF